MKKFVSSIWIPVVMAIVITLAGASNSTAVGPFSNLDFKGTYGMAGQNCCVLGRFSADGAGHVNGGITLAGLGEVHHESLSCTYNIVADGRGSMNCTTVKLDGDDIGDSASATFDLVLVSKGDEVFMIVTVEGGDVEGLIAIAKRQ